MKWKSLKTTSIREKVEWPTKVDTLSKWFNDTSYLFYTLSLFCIHFLLGGVSVFVVLLRCCGAVLDVSVDMKPTYKFHQSTISHGVVTHFHYLYTPTTTLI